MNTDYVYLHNIDFLELNAKHQYTGMKMRCDQPNSEAKLLSMIIHRLNLVANLYLSPNCVDTAWYVMERG